MPKFDKPDSPNIIWGVNALDADLTKPSDSYIQTGWTQVKPPYEYENYSMNKLYQGFAYYNQLGFPEWDSVTEYQANKSYVQGSNNRVYKCIQTHTDRNPATSGNENFWEVFNGKLENAVLSENGYMFVPVSVLGVKREIIVAWCTAVGNVGTNIGDFSDLSVNFPVSISNIMHLQLSQGITTNAEATEMAYSITNSSSSEATARFRRISGSNVGGNEQVRANFLVVGYN